MTLFTAYLLLLIAHYIADYVFQSRWMGDNKSSDNSALTGHVFVYTYAMAVASLFILVPGNGHAATMWGLFVLMTFISHWCTDYITSRETKRFWTSTPQRAYATYNVMGFDQLVHQLTLGLTLWICLPS